MGLLDLKDSKGRPLVARKRHGAAPGSVVAEVPSWPPELREAFEERAAIREYDGGLPRREAERLAYEEVKGGRANG